MMSHCYAPSQMAYYLCAHFILVSSDLTLHKSSGFLCDVFFTAIVFRRSILCPSFYLFIYLLFQYLQLY